MPDPQPSVLTFEAFYDERLERTVRQVALMVGSVAAAEDIVHDAMIEVFRRWGTLRNPGGYLYRCATNGALAWSRRKGRHGLTLVDAEAPAEPEFVEMAELLARLTPRQRAAVVLRYYEDLTEEQIAEAIGCRTGSVGPLLTRARAALREELGR